MKTIKSFQIITPSIRNIPYNTISHYVAETGITLINYVKTVPSRYVSWILVAMLLNMQN